MPRRPTATREAVLAATRRLMIAGNFRPTAAEVIAADGFSERSIRHHFRTLEALHIAAVDEPTAHEICRLLPLTDERALAVAVVLGRVP